MRMRGALGEYCGTKMYVRLVLLALATWSYGKSVEDMK